MGQVGLGGRDRGKGEEERGREGGKRRGVGQSASSDTEAKGGKDRRDTNRERRGRAGKLEKKGNGEAGGETESESRHQLQTGGWEGRTEGGGRGQRDGRGMCWPIESEMGTELERTFLIMSKPFHVSTILYKLKLYIFKFSTPLWIFYIREFLNSRRYSLVLQPPISRLQKESEFIIIQWKNDPR